MTTTFMLLIGAALAALAALHWLVFRLVKRAITRSETNRQDDDPRRG
ncbi:hypothetical protein RSO68_14885 [Halomonas saccharevitans]|uniref:Uncharacterized protein n=1 Tax=Halomonas saccharevitans TaxID=416872 RepID=A0A1I7AKM7_9GAMM|nr:hypothetical protein [Halomonas saccharevitans]MDT8880759.1 hypothetical protein [Halomonas saccharevitans]SFT75529.1 hypothetical protein SAMN04487956_11837 [Halomonas saccharevitans]